MRVLNGGEIVACLPLLFGAAELRERAERLRDSVEDLKLAGAPSLAQAGTAIYPLDGYDGASLIAAAAADVEPRRASRCPRTRTSWSSWPAHSPDGRGL